MPKSAPDKNILDRIRETLKKHPEGIWIRELARQSGIPKSTVHLYLTNHMKNEIDEVLRGRGNFITIVKWKGIKNEEIERKRTKRS